MERLRCGVVYTTEFAAFLEKWWRAQPEHHAAKVPSLEYVHCRDGPRAGESWASLMWMYVRHLPDYELFEIAQVRLHLPRASQKGLKWRCLDAREGELVVHGGHA